MSHPRDRFLNHRKANGEGKCAYCQHSAYTNCELILRYPDGDVDLFRFCDDRCHRYFCFLANPKWEYER